MGSASIRGVRRQRTRALLVAALLGAGCVVLAPTLAFAEGALPSLAADSPADKKAAARAFADGQRAFSRRDYKLAAERFEEAYRHAPHHSALWNAARAWDRADEKPRAANLYARYLDEAPASTRDRNSATEALKELARGLGRLEIHGEALEDVRVDDEVLEGRRVYVTPGTHLVTGRKGGKPAKQTISVRAGETASVSIEPPPPPPPPPPKPKPKSGLSPIVVIAGGVVTVALASATVASGIDVLDEKDHFDAAPSAQSLDAGHSKQTRTNILLGATLGTAALTGVAAGWLVDWHGGGASVGVGPGTIEAHGVF